MESLIQTYAPILKFHHNETYYPCSIEFYLNNSVKYQDQREIAGVHSITPENLCDPDDTKTSKLSIQKNAWADGFNSSTPIYATTYSTSLYHVIQYIFLYAYNGSVNVLGLFPVGEHQCDIERITVQVSKATNMIEHIYYGAHTHTDGLWVSGNDIEFSGSRPVVYIAKHTHATYPHDKTYRRFFGFGNDHTSNTGIHWSPETIQVIDDDTDWNNFKGKLGSPKECPTPKHHLWWKDENGKSTTPWKRFFGL
jgi:hypothetical protein